MQWPSKHTIILLVFAFAWVWTEVTEDNERNARYQEFVDFHKNEAAHRCAVEKRLEALEKAE